MTGKFKQQIMEPTKIRFKQILFTICTGTMLIAIYKEATRKNNILDVFLTNNDQLTQQIIIIETSMSDHNIIQVETNIKIVEEKQNQ